MYFPTPLAFWIGVVSESGVKSSPACSNFTTTFLEKTRCIVDYDAEGYKSIIGLHKPGFGPNISQSVSYQKNHWVRVEQVATIYIWTPHY